MPNKFIKKPSVPKVNMPKVNVPLPKIEVPVPKLPEVPIATSLPNPVKEIEKEIDKNLQIVGNIATDVGGAIIENEVKVALNPAKHVLHAGAQAVDIITGSNLAPQVNKTFDDAAKGAGIVTRASISYTSTLMIYLANAKVAEFLGDFEENDKQTKNLFTSLAVVGGTGGIISATRIYAEYLRKQATGKWQKLPKKLIQILTPYYKIDFEKVRFAEDITINPRSQKFDAITIDHDIFFKDPLNLNNEAGLRLMLHELEHVRQYEVCGGFEQFQAKYLAQALQGYENVELEKQAYDKEEAVIKQIKLLYPNCNLALSPRSDNYSNLSSKIIKLNLLPKITLDVKCEARLFVAGKTHCFWVDTKNLHVGYVNTDGRLHSAGVLKENFLDAQIAMVKNTFIWQEPSPSTKLMCATFVNGQLTSIQLADNNSNIRLMAGDANHLYWQDQNSSRVYRRKVDAGKFGPAELVDKTADKNMVCMAAFGGKLYWRDSNSTVLRCGIPDAKSESIQQVTTIDTNCNAVFLSIDEKGLYWKDQDSTLLYRANLEDLSPQETKNVGEDKTALASDKAITPLLAASLSAALTPSSVVATAERTTSVVPQPVLAPLTETTLRQTM